MTTTAQTTPKPLDLETFKTAVAGTAAAFRCRSRLEPDGGDGGKVFPPTYAGGVYAVEDRRIDGRVVRCVLLDSVQSQANRFEELLMDAFLPSWREAGEDGLAGTSDLPILAVYVEHHGWITSLTAPHRVHDAILRDSEIEGTRFRNTEIGKARRAGLSLFPRALLSGSACPASGPPPPSSAGGSPPPTPADA